jgi:exosortase
MNLRQSAGLVGFALLGVGLWTRHPLGESASDLLPALAAFPLYFWLTAPWRWRTETVRQNWTALGLAAGVLVVGAAIDHTLVLAVGWVLGWRAWLRAEMETGSPAVSWKPMMLLACGFPWLGLEGQALGWWFRYSGAGVSATLFELMGFAVERDGTFLTVQGLPLAVDAACSGLHALQAMLVAGTVLALMVLPGPRFWVGFALLPLLAWASNLLRIMTLGVAGLTFGPDAATGWFHEWGGWAVLMVMFVLCSVVFKWMGRGAAPEART